jgi:predicted anti-sigma-YlaC factor YlaD
VRCETFREALSARLDGEPGPVSAEVVDRHLTTCAECRSWYGRAGAMRQLIAVRAAPAVPDLTELILERSPAPSDTKWPARIALGAVAFAQLTLAVAQFLGVATGMGGMSGGGSMMDHLTHESTAWNFAVGVGLLWAALRPRAAAGQLPLMSGFVAVLTVLSTGDLIGHEVNAGRILSHVLVVLGLALLFVVHRQNRDGHGSNPLVRSALDVEHAEFADGGSLDTEVDSEESHPNRPWRRPASRHHAA